MMKNKAEVVIIGGGIVGILIGYYLTKLGYNDVIILEKSYLGSGSTFRCGTGIRASFTTEEHIVLMRESIKLWKELSQELSVFYRRRGYLWLFRKESDLEKFREFSTLHNKYGVPTRIVNLDEIKEIVPPINLKGIIGGLYDPLAGKADPFDAIYEVAKYLRDKSVKIYTQVEAKEIITDNNRVLGVLTSVGNIKSKNLVIAAGYGSRKLLETIGLDIPLRNIPHHALVTEQFKDAFNPLIIDWQSSTYIVQVKHGNFLMGSEMEETERSPLTPRIDFLPKIVKPVLRLFPWMRYVNILRYWTGYYVMSPDNHPLLGPLNDIEGLFIATGFSGHGFMMSPIVGRCLAEWIIDNRPKIPQAERLTVERIKEGRLIHEKAVFG